MNQSNLFKGFHTTFKRNSRGVGEWKSGEGGYRKTKQKPELLVVPIQTLKL
jgi:hypothetical protein